MFNLLMILFIFFNNTPKGAKPSMIKKQYNVNSNLNSINIKDKQTMQYEQ